MDKLIFNQASIFHLQQLEFQFRRKFGSRFRLSDESSRNELINRSAESSDRIIRQYFERFCHELEPALVEELVMRGVVKPTGNKH
ncbi:MAG: hypothetical protein H6999_01710 [Hahellaceae bacterium]|nr:hypothetical protein [Hahellaceae bacterium]MCP5168467.1 hypothetical protein [Hahellaceae bacterium]